MTSNRLEFTTLAELEQMKLAVRVAFEAMSFKERRRVMVHEVYCTGQRSCPLLFIWQSPRGLLWYAPPYKQSPERNARTSVESARVKRTSDGDRRWNSQAGTLDFYLDGGTDIGIPLKCDHTDATVTADELVLIAEHATPGDPTRQRR